MERKRTIGLFVIMFVIACGGTEVDRWNSPDGRFEAVLYSTGSRTFAMPGHGSDGPGELEIVRVSDGESCGRGSLDLRWQGRELVFQEDHARLQRIADWNLSECSVTDRRDMSGR